MKDALKALFALFFAKQPYLPQSSIVQATGEGGWDEDDADHLRKSLKHK